MTIFSGSNVCQHPSHTQLIGPVGTPSAAPLSGAPLDAIIVPASRPAWNLETAAELAKAVNSHLVLLCSRQADIKDALTMLAERGLSSATVVQVPESYKHEFFEFETTEWARTYQGSIVCAARDCDLSVKRNAGLLLARMLGWERIFFMDDDIRDVSAEALTATVSLLGTEGPAGHYRIAGMTVKEYPDNSVVCHARRLVGEEQDVFVTGSVLAVDCAGPVGFFPDIYNEDWLFFYRDAADGCLTSSGLQAKQIPYNPFENPQRAEGQEFGDVIAEGLYALLDSILPLEIATENYWRAFLAGRKRVLDEIVKRLTDPARSIERQDEISKAIDAAREKLWCIQPDMCVMYIRAWQRDLDRWAELLERLPRVESVDAALGELKLPFVPR